MMPDPVPASRRNYPEQKMQIGVIHHFRAVEKVKRNLTFYAVHNGGLVESKSAAALRKALGVRPGVHDVVFMLEGGVTVMIELKDEETGAITDDQREFHATAQRLGHRSYVVSAPLATAAIQQIYQILKACGWDSAGAPLPPLETKPAMVPTP